MSEAVEFGEPWLVCIGCRLPFTRLECPWPFVDEGAALGFHSVACMDEWVNGGRRVS